jgi:methylated-DNA-[protein]-cysteine S-methyltransferase
MNPLTEKQLEKMLRPAPADADLDSALQGVLARAERDGLMDVAYAEVDSPFGELLIARTNRGVVRVALPTDRGRQRPRDEVLEELAAVVSPRILESPKRLDEERRELEDYFEGRRQEFDVPVDWSLTSPGFRSRALHAVARIPYGRT